MALLRAVQHSPALQACIRAAFASARSAGHATVTVYHLLVALLDDTSVAEVVRDADGSPDRLKSFSAEHAKGREPTTWERFASRWLWAYDATVSSGFRSVLGAATLRARGAELPFVEALHVLDAMLGLGDKVLSEGFAASGLKRLALRRSASHPGQPTHATAAVTSHTQEILILNDHYSEMETVVQVLKEAFGMKPYDAFRTMMRIHRDGSVVLGPYPTEVAGHAVKQALAIAAAADAPLRVEARNVR